MGDTAVALHLPRSATVSSSHEHLPELARAFGVIAMEIGVHLISVSKVTVRFPSNGAGMGR